jgi:hypothetical protein
MPRIGILKKRPQLSEVRIPETRNCCSKCSANRHLDLDWCRNSADFHGLPTLDSTGVEVVSLPDIIRVYGNDTEDIRQAPG